LNIAICDDEKIIADDLKEKTKKLFPTANVRAFLSGEALLAQKELPDILLLDIRMKGMDGMKTAKEIRGRKQGCVIIFVTVDKSFVFKAFDVGAFHYLVKPFTNEKFTEVMTKAAQSCCDTQCKEADKRYIMTDYKGMHSKIYVDDITYAEVYNRKVVIHTSNQEIEYYGRLTELEKNLGEDFFRTHRAYLVNMRYVTRYTAECVTLRTGDVPMSKANFPKFVKAYLKYNQRKGGSHEC